MKCRPLSVCFPFRTSGNTDWYGDYWHIFDRLASWSALGWCIASVLRSAKVRLHFSSDMLKQFKYKYNFRLCSVQQRAYIFNYQLKKNFPKFKPVFGNTSDLSFPWNCCGLYASQKLSLNGAKSLCWAFINTTTQVSDRTADYFSFAWPDQFFFVFWTDFLDCY